MRKLAPFALTLALVASLTVAVARADGQVIATWSFTELHQGGHGGGPLFADGTVAGNFAISANDGRLIVMFVPTTWSWVVPGAVLTLCGDVRVIAFPEERSPPPSPMCGLFPVTDEPQRLVGPNGEFIIRVKLVG
jgi:hypothetical protein